MAINPISTFHPSPSKPKLRLPPGSWDTHCHVFGPRPRFPFASPAFDGRADAPNEKLFALHTHLGIERCVIVQSTTHGLDNSVVDDALAAKAGRYLGIALVPGDVPDAELKRLDRLGFRGCRFNFMHHIQKGAGIEQVLALAPRLAAIGWHLQVHMEGELIGELTPKLARSAVPVVIDHVGRIDAGPGLAQPAFQALLRAMANPKFWVKVSGCDRNTRTGPPYADAVAFAHKLVTEFPDRCVWGTDWPHPNHQGPTPDDGELVDIIAGMAPTAELLAKLMVDNPVRLYERRSAA